MIQYFLKKTQIILWKIVIIVYNNYIFLISNYDVNYSVDGRVWESRGNLPSTIDVASFDKFRGMFVLATNNGLRTDNSLFYQGCSGTIATTLIDLEGDLELSELHKFNDVNVNSDGDNYIAGESDGTYWIYNGSYTEYTDSGIDTIHKVLYVENTYWLFGFNLVKVSTESDPFDVGGGIIA